MRGKTRLDNVIHQIEQRLPESANVDDDDWLVVHSQLTPGNDFKGLVQSAESARQHGDRVGVPEHHLFPNVHVFDDVKLRDTVVPNLSLFQVLRNDSDYFAAGFERRVCKQTHQSDPAAAKNKPNPALSENAAEVNCSVLVGVIDRDA